MMADCQGREPGGDMERDLIWNYISQCCKGHPSSARNGVKIQRAAVSLPGIGDWTLMTRFHDHTYELIIFLNSIFCHSPKKTCHY